MVNQRDNAAEQPLSIIIPSTTNIPSTNRPRRKLQIPLEALFMIDFPTAKHKLSFFMDRKDQRMTIDINSGQKVYSKHFQIDSLNETTTIRSLALVFRQENVTLFIDCKKLAVQNLDVSMTNLYLGMEEPVLKIVSVAAAVY